MVESQPSKLLVAGSIPVSRSKLIKALHLIELAPIVQSVVETVETTSRFAIFGLVVISCMIVTHC